MKLTNRHGADLGDCACIALLIALILFILASGCGTASSAHIAADRAVYEATAPYARLGVRSRPTDEQAAFADTDLAWRRQCGYAPTATAVPGGPDDPKLDAGLPRARVEVK